MAYATLTVGQAWLKNIESLVDDAQKGITADDVEAAQESADREINAFFGRRYGISTTAFQTAPLIVEIAELLGSARLIGFKFAQGGQGDPGLAAELEKRGRDLMRSVAMAGLVDAAGALIPPVSRAVARVAEVE